MSRLREQWTRILGSMTPPPWRSTWSEEAARPGEDNEVVVYSDATVPATVVVGLLPYNGYHVALREEDAAGIVLLRNDLPRLLLLLEALETGAPIPSEPGEMSLLK